MTSKQIILFITGIIFLLSCKNVHNPDITKTSSEQDLYQMKTRVIKTDHFSFFDFNIIEQHAVLTNSVTFCKVAVRADSQVFELMNIHPVLDHQNLKHLYGEYYTFPYWSGGNYCRSKGYSLIKINYDTAFFIGYFGGYEDIDNDSIKDFYYLKITEYGECQAEHTIERFKAILKNDSLIYPGLYETY